LKSTIYILSGLGVDKRVFNLIDFGENKVEYIDWINPILNESIESYAQRISSAIKDKEPILIGLSFGGIIATEIAKIIRIKHVIYVSSAKNYDELPSYYRLIGKLKLHRIIPTSFLKSSNLFTYWFFGVSTDREKRLLKRILNDTNSLFLEWAINRIVKWDNIYKPDSYSCIHGTKDRIIPIRSISNTNKIEKAGHFAVVTNHKEISNFLKEELNKLNS